MAPAKATTLILVTSTVSAWQWRDESPPNLADGREIGEYSVRAKTFDP